MRSVGVLMLMLVLAGAVVAEEPKAVTNDFEATKVGTIPKGWTVARTGTGEGSVWSVVEDSISQQTWVLLQSANDGQVVGDY